MQIIFKLNQECDKIFQQILVNMGQGRSSRFSNILHYKMPEIIILEYKKKVRV